MDASRARVVLADDDVLLREGLASPLDRSGLQVIGQAGDAVELMELVTRLRPELAVVDIRMPPKHSTEGLEAARVIQQDFPETAVVVLSAHVKVAGIGQVLYVTEGTVEKHVRSIMLKLRLPETGEVHRRVLAVLAFLDVH